VGSLVQISFGIFLLLSFIGVHAADIGMLLPTKSGPTSACLRNLKSLSEEELSDISGLRGKKYTSEHLKMLQGHALQAYIDHTFNTHEMGSRTSSYQIAGINPNKLVGTGVYAPNESSANRTIFSSTTEFWLNYLTYLKQDPRFEDLNEVLRYRLEDDLLAMAQKSSLSALDLEIYAHKFRKERLLNVAKRSILQEGEVLTIPNLAQEAFDKNHLTFFQMGNTHVPGTRPAFSIQEFWPILKETLLNDPEFQALSEEKKNAILEFINKRISYWDSSD
jgi:hypothetical protein